MNVGDAPWTQRAFTILWEEGRRRGCGGGEVARSLPPTHWAPCSGWGNVRVLRPRPGGLPDLTPYSEQQNGILKPEKKIGLISGSKSWCLAFRSGAGLGDSRGGSTSEKEALCAPLPSPCPPVLLQSLLEGSLPAAEACFLDFQIFLSSLQFKTSFFRKRFLPCFRTDAVGRMDGGVTGRRQAPSGNVLLGAKNSQFLTLCLPAPPQV